jgi:transposase
VIRAHREYLQDGHGLGWLTARLAPVREQIQAVLEQGVRGRHLKTRRFCAGLLDEYDALWTFCEVEGIDPTNNATERALRI